MYIEGLIDYEQVNILLMDRGFRGGPDCGAGGRVTF